MNSQSAKAFDTCVIGLGYIGLPTAAVIARSQTVLGVDISAHVVDTINAGQIHIEEPDLDHLVRERVASGNLSAALQPATANTYVIAVPTPFTEGYKPDISYVLAAARTIAPHLARGSLVIVESTSPVGTTEQVRDLLAQERPDLVMAGLSDAADVAFAYCPERVLPGQIIRELVQNDRSIGGITPDCAAQAQAFYKSFVEGECIITHARTAEMVKLVENSSRDVSIAFANELSMVADRLGIDVWEVIALANRHPRVNILNPGPGVGGHCIAVDPWFLVDSAPDITPIIRTAREVNDGKAHYVLGRVEQMLIDQPDLTVACLGLAFKADVDDLRESPALEIALGLAEKFGPRVLIVEPHTPALPAKFAATGAVWSTLAEAGDRGGLALLLVDHAEFRSIDPYATGFSRIYDTRGTWRAFPSTRQG